MIPEVAAVIQAAKAWAAVPPHVEPWVEVEALRTAVNALEIRETRAAGPTYEETDRTWGEVVIGDEILSVKTRKWYEVTGSVLTQDGKMKINIKGSTKPVQRDPAEAVRVKRGVLGDAADLFQVLFSGTTVRGAAVTALLAESTEALPEVPSVPDKQDEDEE